MPGPSTEHRGGPRAGRPPSAVPGPGPGRTETGPARIRRLSAPRTPAATTTANRLAASDHRGPAPPSAL